jgi:NAD(P)-dependent dehydrogenase (short-subunit alcohol dehydrogenase family)
MENGTRTGLVTGGAAGLGQAYARRLARDGIKVVVADIADATETVESIRQAGGEAVAVECDVCDGAGIAALGRRLEEDGGVDILVHNAGTYPLRPFDEMPFSEWRAMMAIHLDALYHVCQAFVPGMRRRGWGRVVAVSSDVFHSSVPGLVHYTAAKAGVIGFVRSLATEVGADGVTVNAIAPGLVETPGTLTGGRKEAGLFEDYLTNQAVKRTLVPDDLAGAVAFFASDEAAVITGQTLLIDGGWAFN